MRRPGADCSRLMSGERPGVQLPGPTRRRTGDRPPYADCYTGAPRLASKRDFGDDLNDSGICNGARKCTVRRGGRAHRARHQTECAAERIEARISKVRVVENVVRVRANLQSKTLCHAEVLAQAEVAVEVPRSAEGVTSDRSEASGCCKL